MSARSIQPTTTEDQSVPSFHPPKWVKSGDTQELLWRALQSGVGYNLAMKILNGKSLRPVEARAVQRFLIRTRIMLRFMNRERKGWGDVHV